MNLSELVNNNKCKIDFFNSLIDEIDRNGLGTLSKADFEAFIYNLFCKYKNNDKVMSNFDWIKYLKVTPSKLKSMQQIASIKYQNFDDSIENWNMFIFEFEKNKIEINTLDSNNLKILINNQHVKLFIESFLNSKGFSIDYSFNHNQLILSYQAFNTIIEKLTIVYSNIIKDKNFNETFENKLKELDPKELENYLNSNKGILTSLKYYIQNNKSEIIVSTINLISTFIK